MNGRLIASAGKVNHEKAQKQKLPGRSIAAKAAPWVKMKLTRALGRVKACEACDREGEATKDIYLGSQRWRLCRWCLCGLLLLACGGRVEAGDKQEGAGGAPPVCEERALKKCVSADDPDPCCVFVGAE